MRDVNEALQAIERSSGISKIAFNEDGVVDIVFDQQISINIVRVDETNLEFVTYLDMQDLADDPFAMLALLHANYMGAATGSARLALDPRDDDVLLCERIDVKGLDPLQFEERLLAFLNHATFWRSPEGRKLLDSGADRTAALPDDQFVIRG
jgi:hypothetical protein